MGTERKDSSAPRTLATFLGPWGFQARVPEWDCHFLLRGSSQHRIEPGVSHIVGRAFTIWATRKSNIQWMQKIKREKSKHIITEKSSSSQRQTERKKMIRELQSHQKIMNKMALVSPYLSIKLNKNRLYFPNKRQNDSMGKKKIRPNFILPIKRITSTLRTYIYRN